MFLFYRLRALAALAFLAAAMMSMTQVTHAQSGSPASSAAPQGPPILATNDPQNPFHYTADQQHELFALKVQFQQQATQVMNDKTLSESQKQAKFQAMQKQAFDQFNSTLTPEQKQMMKAATDKRNQVFALRQANMVKVRALSEKLSDSLTAAQKKQILEVKSTAIAKAKSINGGAASPADKQTQLTQLQQSYKQQMLALLTPAQRQTVTQLEAMNAAEAAAEEKIIAQR
jgi:hypothetical protein